MILQNRINFSRLTAEQKQAYFNYMVNSIYLEISMWTNVSDQMPITLMREQPKDLGIFEFQDNVFPALNALLANDGLQVGNIQSKGIYENSRGHHWDTIGGGVMIFVVSQLVESN